LLLLAKSLSYRFLRCVTSLLLLSLTHTAVSTLGLPVYSKWKNAERKCQVVLILNPMGPLQDYDHVVFTDWQKNLTLFIWRILHDISSDSKEICLKCNLSTSSWLSIFLNQRLKVCLPVSRAVPMGSSAQFIRYSSDILACNCELQRAYCFVFTWRHGGHVPYNRAFLISFSCLYHQHGRGVFVL